MASFRTQLDELLRKDSADLVNNQKAVFERLATNIGERYVLFGAGRLGRFTLAGLRRAGVEPLAFSDNNPQLWDSKIEGLKVLSPQSAAKQFGSNAIFVITVYTNAPVWQQLSDMRLKTISFAALSWQYPHTLTPHGGVELPGKIFTQSKDLYKALKLLADNRSRTEYLGQLRWSATLDPSVLPSHLPQKEIYFADELFLPLAEEIFVDCGAFDGDSVQEFINHRSELFNKVIAIEPDPENCKALKNRVSSLPSAVGRRIQIIQSAVGSTHKMVSFNATGTPGSAVGQGSYQIPCTPLDDLLKDVHPTFIKMDIEGAEPDALLGARNIIQENEPVLAICLYHAQEHLWQIPLLIHSFSNTYQFFIRRYADECWELVCYAIPKSRLR
jgi:FkbM family methyltransferase